ncbi:hypothetical protein [Azospirillum sp.]|uniref:hypothetical protein n=1 Tax=Azospirillum sp. TaxID=34012 RepID=UPI003D727C2E
MSALSAARGRAGFGDGWPVLLVALAAAAYHAAYLGAGFNFTDEGHYAQTVLELWRGTDPHDLKLGYGLLWYEAGVALFSVFGPGFTVVRAFLFAVITATTALVYTATVRATDSRALGLAAALAAGLAPAFPATSFYAFCALLNVTVQLGAARRLPTLVPADLLAPGLALAVTFQIRADFGYVFSAPLAALILYAALAAPSGRQLRHLAALAGTALATLVAGHLPLLALAAAGGYADLVAVEYLRYPLTVLEMLRLALAGAPADGGAKAAAGTLLARTPLSALWLGPPATTAMALLTYGPLLVAPVYALAEAAALRRTPRPALPGRIAAGLVVLAGAFACFPHYFLFRPDLAHIANFFPGFAVLLAVCAARLAQAGGGVPAAIGRLAALLLLAAYAGAYLWIGLTTEGTGSIAVARGRTEPFTAANGVNVRLSPEEAAFLVPLRDLTAAQSRPGDRIVCVPYCPGIAFMTGRGLLLREHYVDDSLLVTAPDWIDRAIAATRAARPPLVIVFDWAVNGTEVSRFRVWAARYVEALTAMGAQRTDLPGVTVYRLTP